MSRTHHGRHENGQNDLIDHRITRRIADLLGESPHPVLEIGAGRGALTRALAGNGRTVTAVEIDPRRADLLRREALHGVTVVTGDALAHPLPSRPFDVAGNLPFHLTTAITRRLLAAGHWRRAVLLMQWEAARRRAGVGGVSLLTASWLPWFEFELHGRIPARAFRPVPAVDGGLIAVTRRAQPLVADRRRFQSLVGRVFRAPGGTLDAVLANAAGLGRGAARAWLDRRGVDRRRVPKDLGAEDWADLARLVQSGDTGSARARR